MAGMRLGLAILIVATLGSASAEDFRILSWNVESNRPSQPPVSDTATIVTQIKEQ